VKIVYSDRYDFGLGAHVFPTQKYPRIRARLVGERLVRPDDIVEPLTASWEDLTLVHSAEYLRQLQLGQLSPGDLDALELPWSPEIVEGFRLMVGGTLTAARLALGLPPEGPAREAAREDGGTAGAVVVHLGGGFHHAFPTHGEGFCMFNDVSVAIRALQRDALASRVAIVDLDVHHGNGTATIFKGQPEVFTFSMHQFHNYPAVKPRGSLDIGLVDGAGDIEYLHTLREALPKVMASEPDMLFYLAGADPYDDDQLGGLCLSKEGLRKRDRMVFRAARQAKVPVVVTLAGGYARRLDDTVAIHAATVEEALAVSSGSEL
jgi:acetoin utilization deacetylase AcuC-like enzyme